MLQVPKKLSSYFRSIRLSEIEKIFTIYGLLESDTEVFRKNQNYNAFVITLKNKENLLKLLYENDNQ